MCTTDSILLAVMNAHGNRLLSYISWCSRYTRSINTHLTYSFLFYDTKRGSVDDVYHEPSIMLAAHVYQLGHAGSTATRKIIWVYEMQTIKKSCPIDTWILCAGQLISHQNCQSTFKVSAVLITTWTIHTASTKKMGRIWNRYNLESTRRTRNCK
jgi:hypothetical protein